MKVCERGLGWQLFPCKVWPGVPNSSGYGFVYVRGSGKANAQYIGVHRQALETKLGRPLAQDCETCHLCDVKLCCEPMHLYEGSRSRNMLDVRERGGKLGPARALTPGQETEIRSRYRRGNVKQRDLGAEFGVCQATISAVVRRVA